MAASSTPRKSVPRKVAPKKVAPIDDDLFHYDTKSGGELIVPSLAEVKTGLIRKIRNGTEAEQVFSVVEELCDDDQLAVVDDMDQSEFTEFMAAWRDFSQVNLGE